MKDAVTNVSKSVYLKSSTRLQRAPPVSSTLHGGKKDCWDHTELMERMQYICRVLGSTLVACTTTHALQYCGFVFFLNVCGFITLKTVAFLCPFMYLFICCCCWSAGKSVWYSLLSTLNFYWWATFKSYAHQQNCCHSGLPVDSAQKSH